WICRCFAALLDGGGFPAAASHRTAPGLLFDERVERIRALGGDDVVESAGTTAPRRRWLAWSCRTRHRLPRTVSSEIDRRNGRTSGQCGYELDSLARLATHSRSSLAGLALSVRHHCHLSHYLFPRSGLFHRDATSNPRMH